MPKTHKIIRLVCRMSWSANLLNFADTIRSIRPIFNCLQWNTLFGGWFLDDWLLMMPLSVIYFTIQWIIYSPSVFGCRILLSNPTEKFCTIVPHTHTHTSPVSGHPNGVFCDLRQWRDRRDNYRLVRTPSICHGSLCFGDDAEMTRRRQWAMPTSRSLTLIKVVTFSEQSRPFRFISQIFFYIQIQRPNNLLSALRSLHCLPLADSRSCMNWCTDLNGLGEHKGSVNVLAQEIHVRQWGYFVHCQLYAWWW